MLAGYLPFDDDPANPEGDNINLLYKYIVSTPLTFPEYVTPHARDLLRRILVPDPRKRADLFEVARHSWLSEYSHVVGFITSSTTTSADVGSTHVIGAIPDEQQETPLLARSASVREPSKAKSPTAVVGDLSRKHGNVDQDQADAHPKPTKDNKRRTVQVEYVPPKSQTQRGEPAAAPTNPRTRARAGSQGPVEVQENRAVSGGTVSRRAVSTEKPLPQDPPVSRDAAYAQARKPSSSQRQPMPPPTRPGREQPRAASDTNYMSGPTGGAPPVSMARPTTGGSMTSSTGSRSGALPHRGSYGQPAPPAVAGQNAQGRMSQPKTTRGYDISAPLSQDDAEYPPGNTVPSKFARIAGLDSAPEPKGHKRSNTIGGFFSRSSSVFGKKNAEEKPNKKYPPVSMSGAVGHSDTPRQSMESRRSISFGFGKKRSGSINGSQTTLQEKPNRRFSLLPASFSLKSIGIGKDAPSSDHDQAQDNYLDPPQPQYQSQSRNVSGSTDHGYSDGAYDRTRDSPVQDRRGTSTASPPQHQRYASQPIADPRSGAPPQFLPPMNFRQDQSNLTTESESSLNEMTNRRGQYPPGFNDGEYDERQERRQVTARAGSSGRGVLQKPNRRFNEAYEPQEGNGWGGQQQGNQNAGSSGAARKVMDFFRRRGRDRGA